MRKLTWLQVEIAGQLSGQMADMVGGVVETVGEEPEPESEDMPEQHEEEEEEVTKASFLVQSQSLINLKTKRQLVTISESNTVSF